MSDEINTFEHTRIEENEDILQLAVDYMGKFLSTSVKTVSEFRNGDYSRLRDINDLFEGFQWIYMLVGRICTEYNAEIAVDPDRALQAINSAKEAIKNSDISLLTDVIEYDVIEMVRQWYGDEQ